MAGDWIKMRTNLDTDPAVVRIASGLKLDRFAIVGRLHKIWAWANEHSVDGQDVPVDADFLDSLVATPEFSAQLRSVGWLSGRDGSLSFPNFLRHNGDSAKQRALDAERKRNVRKQSEKCPDDNRTKTGPEKRREEKSISKDKSLDIGQARFAKPTVEEVAAYCLERGNSINAQSFVDFYDSNGWRVGKNPMKNWRAAIRTWEKNHIEKQGRFAAANLDKPF